MGVKKRKHVAMLSPGWGLSELFTPSYCADLLSSMKAYFLEIFTVWCPRETNIDGCSASLMYHVHEQLTVKASFK